MSGAEVLDVGRDAIWLTIQLCAPVLIVGLVVGVGVGLMQGFLVIKNLPLAVGAGARFGEAGLIGANAITALVIASCRRAPID